MSPSGNLEMAGFRQFWFIISVSNRVGFTAQIRISIVWNWENGCSVISSHHLNQIFLNPSKSLNSFILFFSQIVTSPRYEWKGLDAASRLGSHVAIVATYSLLTRVQHVERTATRSCDKQRRRMGGSGDLQGLADGRWFLVNWKPWADLVWWFTELKHGDFP